jgi:sec-independent protein translocase protein TatB
MGNVGGSELLLILVLALLLLGPKRLPEVGEALGRSLRRFRQASHDLRREIGATTAELDVRRDLEAVRRDLDVRRELETLRRELDVRRALDAETQAGPDPEAKPPEPGASPP